MSNERFPQPSSPEKIKEEEVLLRAIQVGRQSILEKSGILAKARKLLPGNLSSIIDANAVATVTWIKLTADDSNTRIPAIRFNAKPTSKFLEELYGPNIVKTIELQAVDINGKLILNEGFSHDDVGSVNEMLASLQKYKDNGELPHLNDHLNAIVDPNDERSDHPSFN